MLMVSKQRAEAGEEVKSLRRWRTEHILTFWCWLVGIITLSSVRCDEYGFPYGKNQSNNGVLPKSVNNRVTGSAPRCLVKKQFCVWIFWFLMNVIAWLFRVLGVLKYLALFTHYRYPLFLIHQHDQCFLWAWWKMQPWLPSCELWERGEMLRAFWLRVKWRYEGSGLGASWAGCCNSERASKSRFSSSELETSWSCSIAVRKR